MTRFHLEAQIVDGEFVAVALREAPSFDRAERLCGTALSDRGRNGADALSLQIVVRRHREVGYACVRSVARWRRITSRQRSQAVPSCSWCRAGLPTLPH